MEIPENIQNQLNQFQQLQQQAQAVNMQVQNVEVQIQETEKALEELKKTDENTEVFKQAGTLLIKVEYSDALSEMEEKGLVIRNHSYNALITLTKKGESIAKYVCHKAEIAVDEVGKNLSPDQRQLLYTTLNQLSGAIHQLSEDGLPHIQLNIEGE